MYKLTQEFACYRWEFVKLLEAWQTGFRETTILNGYKLWFSSDKSKHEHSVGFFIRKTVVRAVHLSPIDSFHLHCYQALPTLFKWMLPPSFMGMRRWNCSTSSWRRQSQKYRTRTSFQRSAQMHIRNALDLGQKGSRASKHEETTLGHTESNFTLCDYRWTLKSEKLGNPESLFRKVNQEIQKVFIQSDLPNNMMLRSLQPLRILLL